MNKLINIIQEEIIKSNLITEKNPIEYNRSILINEITKIAKDINQPAPTKELDSGSDALVFETTNPNILVRAELIESDDVYGLKEYNLAEPDIQETGGVAKIYSIGEYDIGDETYLISLKENVETNYQYALHRKYGDQAWNIIYALNLYNLVYGFNQKEKQTQLDILKNTEETSRLYDAVMNGLPVVDLSPDNNLGMNEEGYIVAYDC